MKKGEKILVYSVVFVTGLFFLFYGLDSAEPFLVPVLTAMVMAFMMLPITNKLEKWGFKKIFATLTSTIILLIIAISFLSLLFFQIRSFTDDWEEIQGQLQERFEDLTEYMVEHTPLTEEQMQKYGIGIGITQEEDEENEQQDEQNDVLREQNHRQQYQQQELYQQEENRQLQERPDQHVNNQDSDQQQNQNDTNAQEDEQNNENEDEEPVDTDDAGQQVLTVMGAVFGFIVDFLITFIYVFLFIHFRHRLKGFILRFFPKERRAEVAATISLSSSVSRSYLVGRLLLMISLAALYYTGLAISGLENAFFISLISAALSIIPFAGNIIGLLIALAVGLLTDGSMGMIIGIIITFIVAQFVDTYILQPIVLGDKLDLHPIFIIMTVILGNEIWGIMGMVLAIPVFGIITVICRHVPALYPFGYLFSKKEIDEPGDENHKIITPGD